MNLIFRSMIGAVLFGSTLLAPAGCTGGSTKSVGTDVCASGQQWTGGDSGSPEMHPGRDCIACHATRGGAPRFTIAGTLFGDARQADDCFGSSGGTVEITGADGKVTVMTTNAAGNFYTQSAVAFPYTARILVGMKEHKMTAAQSTGACNSCHTTAGANEAPGRITTPP